MSRQRIAPGGSVPSEREDWILTLVAAGMGICFLPEFSNTIPGVISRPVIEPSIEREVCLVTIAGRRWSSPVAAFVRAVRQYKWPETEWHGRRGLSESEQVAQSSDGDCGSRHRVPSDG